MTEQFINSDIAKKLANYRLPRYEQLSSYPIIMSQLLAMLDDYLSIFTVPGEEKLLTQAMINSYVRKKIIEAPDNKTYTRKHIIHLISIGILKQVLSLSEAGMFVEQQIKQYPHEVAYNYLCAEIEDALKITFGSRKMSEFKNAPKIVTPLTEGIRSAVIAFANKIYVKQWLYYESHK
ncbi:MAG: DUF1836 domain-containing protein [bacterium]|nr:DUF1836 domain-containing protein [bacterium]